MKVLADYTDAEYNQMYRNVFGSDEGKLVLADILNTLGLFSVDSVPVDGRDFAKVLLRRLGIWKPANQVDIVNALLAIGVLPPEKPKEQTSYGTLDSEEENI